jgi:hypothetical protein
LYGGAVFGSSAIKKYKGIEKDEEIIKERE